MASLIYPVYAGRLREWRKSESKEVAAMSCGELVGVAHMGSFIRTSLGIMVHFL